MAAADFANWWDEKMSANTASLEEWVLNNPGMASVILATAGASVMDLSSGFVDVLRLGEGVGAAATDDATAWDIAKGLGSDVLRAVSIIPIGKGVSMIVKVGLQRVAVKATLYSSIRGGLCGPIASSQAIRRSGQSVAMKLDDILQQTHGAKYADLLGDALESGTTFGRLKAVLDGFKLKSELLPVVNSLDDVARLLKGSDVMVVKIKWRSPGAADDSFHFIHAFFDHLGRLRFADRTGHVVKSLKELGRLEPGYGGIENAVLGGTERMLKIKGLQLLELADKIGFGEMFLAFTPQLIVNSDQADPEIVAQSIEAKIMRDNGQIPEKLPAVPAKSETVNKGKPKIPPVEYLTGVKFRLNHLGYAAGPPVHVNDEKCKEAIRAFQKDYKLKVDAIPGPKTQARLREVCGY